MKYQTNIGIGWYQTSKVKINCQKFVLGVAIKMLNQLCNIFTPIVKVFVLAWYLI